MTRSVRITFVVLALISIVVVCLSALRFGCLTDPFTLMIHLLALVPPFACCAAFLWPRFLLLVLICSGVQCCVGFIILLLWVTELLPDGNFGYADFALVVLETTVLPTAYFVLSAVAIRRTIGRTD